MSKDLKYILLPAIENRRRTPKFQPWPNNNSKYRERFKMKYPCHMDTKNWKFVKDGLDDFRDGLPPSHDKIMLEPDKDLSPVILSQKQRRIKADVSNIRNRLNDHQIYFSRELPTAEKRRQLIDDYIAAILEHPIAFFTHFSDALAPELYERVTKLLEADLLRMNSEEPNFFVDEYKEVLSISPSVPITRPETGITEKTISERSNPSNNPQQPDESDTKSNFIRPGRSTIIYDESGNPWDAEEYERKQKNPYRWYIEKQREKLKAKGLTQDEQATSAMEARLRNVAEQFCSWLHNLDDETPVDIDPGVVRNLFSTAYDTKPALSVPIKIVEMTRIPPELREGAKDKMFTELEQSKTLPTLSLSSSITKSKKYYTLPIESAGQSPRKYRYGAWYLPRNLWQRSLVNEQLRDPKEIKAELEDASRKRDEQITARLAPLHGIDSFKDYLVEKNVRRLPKLITDVEQYRIDHPRELTNSTVDFQTKQTFLYD